MLELVLHVSTLILMSVFFLLPNNPIGFSCAKTKMASVTPIGDLQCYMSIPVGWEGRGRWRAARRQRQRSKPGRADGGLQVAEAAAHT